MMFSEYGMLENLAVMLSDRTNQESFAGPLGLLIASQMAFVKNSHSNIKCTANYSTKKYQRVVLKVYRSYYIINQILRLRSHKSSDLQF